MTLSVLQAATAAYNSGITPVATALGSAPTSGNLLVVVYSTFGAQPTTPTGWTNQFWESSGGDSFGVYSKTAGASEPTAPFSVASTNNCAMSIWEVVGATALVDVTHTTGASGAGPFTTPTNTTSTAFSLMLQALHIRDTSSPIVAASSAGSWTSDATAADTSSTRTASIGHQIVSTSGSVVAPDFTVPDASYDRGALAVIEISGNGSPTVSVALPIITVAGGTWAAAGNTGALINVALPVLTVAGGAWAATTTGRPGPALSQAGRGVVPNSTVRGIRSPVSQGTLLGRSATGTGDVQILKPADLGLATKTDVQAVADAAASGAIGGLALVATTGQYGDLLSLPTISTVGHTGAYADLTGKPSLAAVATSGSASDLTTGTLAAARLPAFTSGDVTSSIGTVNLTIGNNVVTLAKMATIATGSFLGRATAGTGNVEVLSAASVRTVLGLATVATSGLASDLSGTLNVAQLPALSGGDVTSSVGSGSLAIGANKVTLAQMAQITTASILGRNTASTGNVEVLSAATVRSILSLATVATSGLASDLTGTLPVTQLPAMTGGDVTSSAGSGSLAIGAAKVTSAQLAASAAIGNITGGTINLTSDLTFAATLSRIVTLKAVGGAMSLNIMGEGASAITFSRYQANSSQANHILQKARGTIATPAAVINNDAIGALVMQGHTGSGFVTTGVILNRVIAATPSPTDMQSSMIMQLVAAGSATQTTILTADWTNGIVPATKVVTVASTTTAAGLNIPHGAAPTSPVNGDIWTTSAGLFVRINGVTVGPLS